jgi:hypothetical protein
MGVIAAFCPYAFRRDDAFRKHMNAQPDLRGCLAAAQDDWLESACSQVLIVTFAGIGI